MGAADTDARLFVDRFQLGSRAAVPDADTHRTCQRRRAAGKEWMIARRTRKRRAAKGIGLRAATLLVTVIQVRVISS